MRFPRVPSGRLRLVKGALILLQEIAGDEGEPGPLGWFGSGKRLQVGEALVPVGMVPGIGIGEEAAFRGRNRADCRPDPRRTAHPGRHGWRAADSGNPWAAIQKLLSNIRRRTSLLVLSVPFLLLLRIRLSCHVGPSERYKKLRKFERQANKTTPRFLRLVFLKRESQPRYILLFLRWSSKS